MLIGAAAENQKMFAAEKHFNQVGAFEGAMHEARGYYRLEVDLHHVFRGQITSAKRAIENVIAMYSAK